jgi:hypothetical protein
MFLPTDKVGHQDANPITQMIWANTLVNIVLAVPSLTVMLLFRYKIGYRTLQPWMLLVALVGMLAMSGGSSLLGLFDSQPGASSGGLVMLLMTLAVFGSGVYQRTEAWNRIRRGIRWHTKSRGVSYLSAILPLSEHVIQRYIEPLLCAALGVLCVATISRVMGFWLLFSGTTLACMEAIIYDVQLNSMLDMLDSMVESDVAAENMAFFSNPQPQQAAPTVEAMSGITVGFAPDLQRVVAWRRATRASHASAATPSA